MVEKEYLPGDDALFAMMAKRKPTVRKTVGVVLPASRVRELEQMERRLDRIHAMSPIIPAVLVAAIFFAATMLGWMTMPFGSAVTLAAAVRAITLYWRYRHGGKR